jgi:tetratricopeptide (TPR) repeat protein
MSENPLQTAIDLVKTGDRQSAKKALLDFLADNPDSEMAWLWLAAACEAKDEKRKCLRRALALNPGNLQAQQALANLGEDRPSLPADALTPSSNAKPARITAEAALAVEKFVKSGQIAAEAGNYAQAYKAYSQALDLDADNLYGLLGKGLCAGMLGARQNLRAEEVRLLLSTPSAAPPSAPASPGREGREDQPIAALRAAVLLKVARHYQDLLENINDAISLDAQMLAMNLLGWRGRLIRDFQLDYDAAAEKMRYSDNVLLALALWSSVYAATVSTDLDLRQKIVYGLEKNESMCLNEDDKTRARQLIDQFVAWGAKR